MLQLRLQRLELRLRILVVSLEARELLQVLQILLAHLVVLETTLYDISTELVVVLVRELELRRLSHRAVLRHVLNLVVEQQVGSVGELQVVGDVRHRVG